MPSSATSLVKQQRATMTGVLYAVGALVLGVLAAIFIRAPHRRLLWASLVLVFAAYPVAALMGVHRLMDPIQQAVAEPPAGQRYEAHRSGFSARPIAMSRG